MSITKTYDMLNIKGVKGWIRDSWARRKITALQATVEEQATTIAALEARIAALEGGSTT